VIETSALHVAAGRPAAAQLLLEEAMDAGTHQHRQVIFEPDLVIRQSSRRAK
jgi:LacI family transcriptional regulator